MIRNERIEMKVGLFMGIGLFVMFLIVFSVSDLHLLREAYEVEAVFDFVNGIKTSSPVRLAGVNVGEVSDINIFYDEAAGRTRVGVKMRVRKGIRIEKDAIVRVNTLGLLGEQYAEITPGTLREFLSDGDVIEGRNPVNVGQQMEVIQEVAELVVSMVKDASEGKGTIGKLLVDDSLYVGLADVLGRISKGEGTLGMLLTDDAIYNDLVTILGRIRDGEGTIGKFLVDEEVYENVRDFTDDIRRNPWKLLRVTPERTREDTGTRRGTVVSPR